MKRGKPTGRLDEESQRQVEQQRTYRHGVLRRCLNIITLLSERDIRSLRDSRVLVRCASAMSEHHYIIVRKGQTITDRGTAAYWYGVPRRCLNIIVRMAPLPVDNLKLPRTFSEYTEWCYHLTDTCFERSTPRSRRKLKYSILNIYTCFDVIFHRHYTSHTYYRP